MPKLPIRHIESWQEVELSRLAEQEHFLEGDIEAFLEHPELVRVERPQSPALATAELIPRWENSDQVCAWVQEVYDSAKVRCPVPELQKFTKVELKALRDFGYIVLFVPLMEERSYPAEFQRIQWKGRRINQPEYIQQIPLKGQWIAVETITKPDWNYTGYPNDQLFQKLGGRFCRFWSRREDEEDHDRSERNKKKFWYASGLEGVLKIGESLKKLLGIRCLRVRVPTLEEWNFIANVFNWLRENRKVSFPDLGSTRSWEHSMNTCRSGEHLVIGHKEHGGIRGIDSVISSMNYREVGFRYVLELSTPHEIKTQDQEKAKKEQLGREIASRGMASND